MLSELRRSFPETPVLELSPQPGKWQVPGSHGVELHISPALKNLARRQIQTRGRRRAGLESSSSQRLQTPQWGL